MSLQEAKILTLVLRSASNEEIIPMLAALRSHGVTYIEEDYQLICRRGSVDFIRFCLTD